MRARQRDAAARVSGRYGVWLAALCAGWLAAGCGDDHHDHEHGDHGDAGGHDHGDAGDHGHGHPDADCAGDEHPYTAGTEVSGDEYRVRIVSASPNPHETRRTDNRLTVAVLDAQGMPVEGAQVTVTPRTDAHGADLVPVVTEEADGEYAITNLSYVHAGTWSVHFDITRGGVSERLTLRLCIEPGPL
jgi:hypothetical protein